jgi:hypothetical protein
LAQKLTGRYGRACLVGHLCRLPISVYALLIALDIHTKAMRAEF